MIVFNALDKTDIRKIVTLEMHKLSKRVNQLGYSLELTEKAYDFIADKGFDEKNGARPLNRAIQKYVEDLIAENVVTNTIKEGDHLFLDFDPKDDKLSLKVASKEESTS